MQINNLKKLRLKRKLSITELCQVVGIDVFQHVLYEANICNVPIPHALEYCEALDSDLLQIFPLVRKKFRGKRLEEFHTLLKNSYLNDKATEILGALGIEADPRTWIIKAQLSNGGWWIRDIPASEARRLQSAIYNGFYTVVFDTLYTRIILHRHGIAQIQLLWEGMSHSRKNDEHKFDEPGPDASFVSAYLTTSTDICQIGIEEYPSTDPDQQGQLQNLYALAEINSHNLENEYTEYAWIDCDGEDVWFNESMLAILETPIGALDARIGNVMSEIYDEEYGED
jgi:transcriptional regulator with XRE-family HTH domain